MAVEVRSTGSSIKSAERVMAILRFLASRARPVPSMVVAAHCRLPRSSAYHLLNCMQERHFVIYYPDHKAWGLGPAAYEIGTAYLRADPLAWLGRPMLQDLANECGVTAHLAVLHGRDVLYLVKEIPEHRPTSLVSRVGIRLPAHLTAVGRAMLMALSGGQLRAIYTTRNLLVRRTRRGPQLVSELERELSEDRQRGYAIDEGMTTPNVTCIASTVFSHESVPIAGLGITFPSGMGPDGGRDSVTPRVIECARSLSTSLGWPGLTGKDVLDEEPRGGWRWDTVPEPTRG